MANTPTPSASISKAELLESSLINLNSAISNLAGFLNQVQGKQIGGDATKAEPASFVRPIQQLLNEFPNDIHSAAENINGIVGALSEIIIG